MFHVMVNRVMRVTNTILGRMQSSFCPLVVVQVKFIKTIRSDLQVNDSWGWNGFNKNTCSVVECNWKFLIKEMMSRKQYSRRFDCCNWRIEHEFWNVKERIYTTIYTSVLLKQFLGFQRYWSYKRKVRIKLEEGIQSGKILRLKEKESSINGYGNGDLLVHVWRQNTVTEKQFLETIDS
jgi:molecular chaperone DnaJ